MVDAQPDAAPDEHDGPAAQVADRRPRRAFVLLVTTVLVGCLVYLMARAFSDPGDIDLTRPWLLVALVAAVAVATAWLVGERERSAGQMAEGRSRAAAERAEADAARARATAEKAQTAADEAHAAAAEAQTVADRARAGEAAARRAAEEHEASARAARESERDARAGEDAARRAAQEARQSAERDAQHARESARAAEEKHESEQGRLRDEVLRERTQREQVIRAWRGEREWNRDLRTQIERMQRAQGTLGRHDDVRRMVLELTMNMVDADKGLLLARREDGAAGHEVVCFAGFDNDPRDSALAQRFADEVIEREATVRQDDESDIKPEKRTPADEEVRNLLAIPIYLSDDFAGVIVCANRDGGFAELDDEVLLAVGDHAGAVLENSRLHGNLRNAYLSTISVLANAIELKDPELRGHSDHVSEYVLAVADRLGFEPERRERLIFASLLHDVGKLGISERILLKPAELTAEERATIQLHPRIGYQLVRQVPALQEIAPAVLHHHERFDGKGYPGRLCGETIPLESRIIAVADSFSAITSDRPYSSGRSPEEACLELERCAGGQFDPEVVRLFVEEVRRHPPVQPVDEPLLADPELEVHRADGEYRLGTRSFGITDSLTLLYSHRHLHESAHAEALRASLQGRPFGVALVNLVGLGELNRTRGFAAGDDALQRVGEVFQRVAARSHGLAFRASGRRIALLIPDLDPTALDAILASLRLELMPSLNGDHDALAVTLGGTVWRPGDDGEQVIDRAQRAADLATAL